MTNQNKKVKNQDTIHFEIAIYRVLHERSNNTALFPEQLTFPEKMTFAEVFRVKHGKKRKSSKDTIHFQTARYRVLHKRSNITASFEEHLKFQE